MYTAVFSGMRPHTHIPSRNSLHFAVLGGKMDAVRALVPRIPSMIIQQDGLGFTPLTLALALGEKDSAHSMLTCQEFWPRGDVRPDAILPPARADQDPRRPRAWPTRRGPRYPRVEDDTDDEDDAAPIRWGVGGMDRAEDARRLFSDSVTPRMCANVATSGGVTPAMLAAKRDFVGILARLHDMGADINAVDEDGFTAAVWAGRNNAYNCLALLRARGVGLAGSGSRAVLAAAAHGHALALRVLLSPGKLATKTLYSGDGGASSDDDGNSDKNPLPELDPASTTDDIAQAVGKTPQFSAAAVTEDGATALSLAKAGLRAATAAGNGDNKTRYEDTVTLLESFLADLAAAGLNGACESVDGKAACPAGDAPAHRVCVCVCVCVFIRLPGCHSV